MLAQWWKSDVSNTVLIISTNMRITLKDFQYELILKYLILVTEIYVSILFFINVFPTWLINQRYPCIDILPPSQPGFFLYLSQGSKRKISVLPTGPLQGQLWGAGRWAPLLNMCLVPGPRLLTLHSTRVPYKRLWPRGIPRLDPACTRSYYVHCYYKKKKWKKSFKFLTICHIFNFF